MRQETGIGLFIHLPVSTMQRGVVELILHLSPCVMEHIGTLFRWPMVERRLEFDLLTLAVLDIDPLQSSTSNQKELFSLLVCHQSTGSDILDKQFRVLFLQVMYPQVIPLLKSGTIIEFIPFFAQDGIPHV